MVDKYLLSKDPTKFKSEIMRVANETGFDPRLIEKDYYLSVVLYNLKDLDKKPLVENFGKENKFNFLKEPVFKGGTALNKAYYGYYRLSEDLDFTIRFAKPNGTLFTNNITRGMRSRAMESITAELPDFAARHDMKISHGNPGNDNNRQYVYHLLYESIIDFRGPGEIKLDIGLYANVMMIPDNRNIQHKFHGPFNDEELITKSDPNISGNVYCLNIKELFAEKLRAGASRGTDPTTPEYGGIAPRDFYDVNHMIMKGVSLADRQILEMFKIKGFEDGKDWLGLPEYINNLGRSPDDMKLLYDRVETRLKPVLTPKEFDKFVMKDAVNNICNQFKKIVDENIFSDLNKPETLQEYHKKQ